MQKEIQKENISLELMHHRLGHRSTRSLMAGDTANFWEDAELKIDADPFFTSCKISSMNKKARPKVPLKPKAPFKWVFMYVIPSKSPKSLTNDTNFKHYLLIVDAYSKIGAQINQIFNGWGYCQCLGRCRAANRCRPFLHFLKNFFNQQKG